MDFDAILDRRGTNCTKWESGPGEDILPMWVADMDFACPEEVSRAVIERAKHPLYGYTFPGDSCYRAIIDKMRADYGWAIEREWIVFCSGIVEGVNIAARAYTSPGDNILLQEPAYFPFFSAITGSGCSINSSLLLRGEDGRYALDFDDMERRIDRRTRSMIFCSPHNPTGRVWNREELTRAAQLCIANDCVIISDEIHCDIVMKPHRHTVFATLSKEVERRTVTFMSPSKTFNLAGLSAAIAIIPDGELRKCFCAEQQHHGTNLFGYTALEAAYRHGSAYREAMVDYVSANMDCFLATLARRLPMLRACKPEGTYLLWVDMSALGMEADELDRFMLEKCRIRPNAGTGFGRAGEGFLRFNLACPRAYIVEALVRMERAILALETP